MGLSNAAHWPVSEEGGPSCPLPKAMVIDFYPRCPPIIFFFGAVSQIKPNYNIIIVEIIEMIESNSRMGDAHT